MSKKKVKKETITIKDKTSLDVAQLLEALSDAAGSFENIDTINNELKSIESKLTAENATMFEAGILYTFLTLQKFKVKG